jgi:hypothetical protein
LESLQQIQRNAGVSVRPLEGVNTLTQAERKSYEPLAPELRVANDVRSLYRSGSSNLVGDDAGLTGNSPESLHVFGRRQVTFYRVSNMRDDEYKSNVAFLVKELTHYQQRPIRAQSEMRDAISVARESLTESFALLRKKLKVSKGAAQAISVTTLTDN